MEHEINNFNPISICCSSCGAIVDFDIINQNYHCKYCGMDTDITAPVLKMKTWKKAKNVKLKECDEVNSKTLCSCEKCGSKIVINVDEAQGKCEFCGGNMLRSEFIAEDNFPAGIIPFFINIDEAKEEVKKWADNNNSKSEAKTVLKYLSDLKGYYLPYQMVRGPVYCTVERDATNRIYNCGGYLDGMVVNTSKNLDNSILDAIEPFYFNEFKEMEFGYIAGQKVKLQDLNEKELNKRVKEEIKTDYEKKICRTLQTTGIDIKPQIDNMLILPAMMPVYILNSKEVKLAVNGQTGRIAVSNLKDKVTIPWIIEPFIITLVVAIISWVMAKDASLTAMFTVITGLPTFIGFGQNRKKRIQKKILKTKESFAQRKDGKLIIKALDKKSIKEDNTTENKAQEETYNKKSKLAEPVFFENINDEKVPVKVSFYPPQRIIKWLILLAVYNLLPILVLWIASAINIIRGVGPLEILYQYVAAWLCISVSTSFIIIMMYMRIGVYDKPVFRKIIENNKTEKIPKKYYDTESVFKFIKNLPVGIVIFFVCVIIFFLLGSIVAMLP